MTGEENEQTLPSDTIHHPLTATICHLRIQLGSLLTERIKFLSKIKLLPFLPSSQKNDDDFEDLEVDYDNNVTDLYRFISNFQWQEALQAISMNPIEAKTWVVRYHEDENKGMMWRFLPLHSASARQPPEAVITALIDAYPEGVIGFLSS